MNRFSIISAALTNNLTSTASFESTFFPQSSLFQSYGVSGHIMGMLNNQLVLYGGSTVFESYASSPSPVSVGYLADFDNFGTISAMTFVNSFSPSLYKSSYVSYNSSVCLAFYVCWIMIRYTPSVDILKVE